MLWNKSMVNYKPKPYMPKMSLLQWRDRLSYEYNTISDCSADFPDLPEKGLAF